MEIAKQNKNIGEFLLFLNILGLLDTQGKIVFRREIRYSFYVFWACILYESLFIFIAINKTKVEQRNLRIFFVKLSSPTVITK